MATQNYDKIAQRLRWAYSKGPIPSLRDEIEACDAEAAYAIQAINTDFWIKQGRRLVGRKAGLTAEAVQQQLGVDQPDYGVLFEDMRIANGGLLDPARTISPKAEAEIAFVLRNDLPDPNTDGAMVANAVESVHAAIEVVDSRIADWNITFADTVADNGSSAFFVLSEEGQPLGSLNLEGATMELKVNGKPCSHGTGAAVLGNPLNAAAWLAQTLAQQSDHLRAGDIILAGALGPMVSLTPGDKINARIDGIGDVSFTYGT